MRYIGIQHRRKRTTEGEARPTRVCIIQDGEIRFLDLEDDTAEKDFMLGKFPVEFRTVEAGEDISSIPAHQRRERKLKKDERSEDFPECLLRQEEKQWLVAEKVPCKYDGLQKDDVVGMVLGGSGDRLAHALSRRGEEIGAQVWRIPPFRLKELRGEPARDKDEDHQLLAEMVRDAQCEFYLITPRERELIRVTEAFRWRQEAMKARIGCEQRLLQRVVGRIFLDEEGRFPEGSIEDVYDAQKATDHILLLALEEENERERDLTRIVKQMDVFRELFEPLDGVGPMIAARLIVAIRDIRRFGSKARLRAYLGAHVLNGGRFGDRPADKQFARRRGGEVANWQPDGRQALYLLADQFNRRPDSEWGRKLRQCKLDLRSRHPDVLCKECGGKWDDCPSKKSHTRKYTDGHIHKMALWRASTKFVDWLWQAWWDLERRVASAEAGGRLAAASR